MIAIPNRTRRNSVLRSRLKVNGMGILAHMHKRMRVLFDLELLRRQFIGIIRFKFPLRQQDDPMTIRGTRPFASPDLLRIEIACFREEDKRLAVDGAKRVGDRA